MLIASGLMLLVVVSAIVAFQGWPGQGLLNDLESLTLDDDRPTLALSGPAQLALDAAPAAAAVAAAPAPGSAAAAPPGASTAGAPNTFVPDDTPGPPPSFVGPGSEFPNGGPPQGVGGTTSPQQPEGVRRVTGDVGATAETITGSVGETVGGVNPQVGETVTETGKNLNELVQGLDLP